MDFLSNLSKLNDAKDNHQDKPQNQTGDKDNNTNDTDNFTKHRSSSDVLHSAKVVAEAAQAHLRHEPDKYDKSELAHATADLLNAAQEYGKLEDDKGIGKYVEKAEEYLRNYNNTSHPTAATAGAGAATHGGEKSGESGSGGGTHEGGEKHSAGGGYGDYIKMAGDFLKK